MKKNTLLKALLLPSFIIPLISFSLADNNLSTSIPIYFGAPSMESLFWPDYDGDGYGDASAEPLFSEETPFQFVDNNLDCDDSNPDINPSASESCNLIDDNCNGSIDDGFSGAYYYTDADFDSYGDNQDVGIYSCDFISDLVINNSDCDDSNPEINPSASESCNLIDDNCNGTIDDGFSGAYYYSDADFDSYGNNEYPGIYSCDFIWDMVTNNSDCNDANPSINPSVTETCNGVDDNCDGNVDEGSILAWYADFDFDNYGHIHAVPLYACTQPYGYADNNFDCNDENAFINPGAIEICNIIDDNCNYDVDEGYIISWWIDYDGDGFGNNTSVNITTCDPPSNYADNNFDCHDSINAINPSMTEFCNLLDDDCNSLIDDIDPLYLPNWYEDLDGDGYGSNFISNSCLGPLGSVNQGDDCDDANTEIHPGIYETCNFIDDNCNGLVDDGIPFVEYYYDLDFDGYGRPDSSVSFCDEALANSFGFIVTSGDCADNNPGINPGIEEVCNIIDDDCNGDVDDGIDAFDWFADIDHDGFGNFAIPADPPTTCYYPIDTSYDRWVLDNTDCMDESFFAHPEGIEWCDGQDNDCDGMIDETLGYFIVYADDDFDGYGNDSITWTDCINFPAPGNWSNYGGDCDDTNPEIPSLYVPSEICNGIDDNCNGIIDEGFPILTYYADFDYDYYGNPNDSIITCEPLSNYVDNNLDCNDSDYNVNPAQYEICNSIDDNCNGILDEETVLVSVTTLYGTDLCVQPKIKLSATKYTGYSYQWYRNNNKIISATSSNYNAKKIGNYTVRIKSPSGCSGTSNEIMVTKACKLSNAENGSLQLLVYPNPTTREFTVYLTSDTYDQECTMKIYNIMGEIIHEQKILFMNNEINEQVSLNQNATMGLYTIKITLNDREVSTPLIVTN
ncbi:MAG: MopE-related protein [Chitinophagales bacterium]